MNFTPIASSSAGNSYLLSCEGHPGLLIEAGVPWAEIQKALNFESSKLAGVAVTHGHGDHGMSAIAAAKAGLDIYVSPGTFGELKVPKDLSRRFRNVVGAPLMVGPWKLGAFPVEHDAAEPVGFLVGAPDGDKLVYISDSRDCEIQFSDLTHICVECNHHAKGLARANLDDAVRSRIAANHMSLERCLEFLKLQSMDKVREIWLLHLSESNSDAALYRDTVQKATGRPTFVAESSQRQPTAEPLAEVEEFDGMIVRVENRKSQSGATVLQVSLDSLEYPVFAPDARMHGFLLSGRGKVATLSVRRGRTQRGALMGTLVDIVRIGGQFYRDLQPFDPEGPLPGVPEGEIWPDDGIPY